MKRIIQNLIGGSSFKREFRKQLRLFIIVTLAFTIAFSWRQTIFDASQALIKHYITINGETTASIITSLFITIVALLIIYIASKLLKDHPDYL